MNFKNTLLSTLLLLVTSVGHAAHHGASVGSTLNQKVGVELKDVPSEVKDVIKAAHPKFTMQEAEKELKHGNTYFDIEGLDGNGNEIEFDMLLTEDGSWRIAEIQRDLTLAQCPQIVVSLLNARVPNINVARIIESDQGDGVIVYEFYTVDGQIEKKYEIKLEVSFLEKEWAH